MGFADIHRRTDAQIAWDELHREAMEMHPAKSAREVRRLMARRHGHRPGGGFGLNHHSNRPTR